MDRTLDIAIVGYGIAGIAAAIRLRRLGHRIVHFDRHDPPIARGAGMLLHPPAVRQLNQLGVMADALACGAPVRHICAQTTRGRSILNFSYGDGAASQAGLGIQRSTLHRLLSSVDSGRDAVRTGRKIVSLDHEQGYLLEDPSVRHGPFDLIVIADGTNSLLRKSLSAFIRRDKPAKSAALVGLFDDPEGVAGDRLAQYFASSRHFSVWPVGCESIGAPRRCSIAINVPLITVESFRDENHWRKLLVQLQPSVGELINDSVTNSNLHIFAYSDVELSQLTFGRAVFIGDAAHSMSPQLGNGAQLAMEDAAMLADAIDQHGDLFGALHTFTMTRTQQLRRYHRVSRWMTPLFQSDSRVLAILRDYLFANAMNLPFVRRFAHRLLDELPSLRACDTIISEIETTSG